MPRKSDWTDYIPASGEASVGLNLKGRYGGKSGGSMRRRRYSSSRYRGVPRRSRYWFPNYLGDQYESGWQSLDTTATPVNIRSYNAGAFAANNTAEPEDLNEQTLLMTQGYIFARLYLLQETPENPTPTQLGNHDHQFQMLSWFWSVDELEPDGSLPSPSQYRFNAPGGAGSFTNQMLRRKDILNWGIKPLVWENRLQMYGGDNTQVPQYQQDNKGFPWTVIPGPRIPRRGIRLGPTRMVNLHTTIMGRNLTTSSVPPWLDSEFYAGHFRWLLAK